MAFRDLRAARRQYEQVVESATSRLGLLQKIKARAESMKTWRFDLVNAMKAYVDQVNATRSEEDQVEFLVEDEDSDRPILDFWKWAREEELLKDFLTFLVTFFREQVMPAVLEFNTEVLPVILALFAKSSEEKTG